MSKRPTPYERQCLAEIHAWKDPRIGWFGQTMRVVNGHFDKAGNLVMATPVLSHAIKAAIQGILSVSNDAAQWSVRPDAIYAEYRKAGHAVCRATDIAKIKLEHIDRTIGWLGGKYKGLALLEGASTGAAGLPGLVVDLPALVTLNLRAIGEYATYCGFDVSRQQERLFAMNILGLTSSPNDAAKSAAMAQIVRISQDVAKKKAWRQLEKHALVKVMKQIAHGVGIRLTKAKLAQSVPIAGAIVGGGFNAYYTSRVCDAAFYLYRERLLAQKYGPRVIEETVRPARAFGAGYDDDTSAS